MERVDGLALFEHASELLAKVLVAALLCAVIWRAELTLPPEAQLAMFENQYAALWSSDEPMFQLASPSTAMVDTVLQYGSHPIR